MTRKGKEVATDSRPQHDDHDMDGDSSESPPIQLQKRKRTTKGKGRSSDKDKQPAKKKMTVAQRASTLRKMHFVPTKWADLALLEKMGIIDDVVEIFRGMGLGGILNMAQPSHREETIQFISSLRFEDDTSQDVEDQNRGKIHFKVHGKAYSMLVAQLPALYNLPSGGTISKLSLDWEESLAVWKDIAKGTFKKGQSKSSMIRHPALRYAHIILAHTLFGRKEKGHVKEEELGLLIEGIKGSLVTTTNGRTIIGQTEGINYGRFLVKCFLKFQEGVEKNEDASPSFHFGGLITPILTALEIRISKPDDSPIMRISTKELMANHFFAGMVGERFAYRFTSGAAKSLILLPNRTATTFVAKTNILFHPGVHHLYDPAQDGPIQGIAKKRGGASQAVEQEEEVDEDEDPISGSSRYKFSPYAGIVSGDALRSAHQNINILHRFIKWQNKTIKKLARGFKKQKKQIKELKATCLNLQRSSSHGDSSTLPRMLSQYQETEEASDTWGGSGKAPISPTSSGSGNPSYSLGSSSNEE